MAVKTKAAILAEIASLIADNTTGDISASDIRTCLIDITDSYFDAPYKKYVALLTQTGTSAPVATVLENTLSGTPVWSYDGVGEYLLTLTGEFTSAKTFITISPKEGTNINLGATRSSDDTIYLSSSVSEVYANGALGSNDATEYTSIEIRVYP